MIDTLDEVRAWKDEDYREALGVDLEHPAGTIDLSALGQQPFNETITISYQLCQSIVQNCFTSWPYVCTTVNCYSELADSRN